MLPNRILYQILEDMYELFGLKGGVWAEEGRPLVLFQEKSLDLKDRILSFSQKKPSKEIDGRIGMFLLELEKEKYYILSVEGDGNLEMGFGFLRSQIKNLSLLLEPAWKKERFFLRLLHQEMEEAQVEVEGRRKKIGVEGRKIFFLISSQGGEEGLILKILESMYTHRQGNCFLVKRGEIGLLLPLQEKKEEEERKRRGREILSTLQMEAMVSVKIGVGWSFSHLIGLKEAYQQAQRVLQIGERLYPEKQLLFYEELPLGHIVDAISPEASERLLREVLFRNWQGSLSPEEEVTVHTFFECNLNISEAARKLFLHRNTLMNRIEKIQRKTGFDIRNFDDAMTLRLSIMIEKKQGERKEKTDDKVI